MPECTPISVTDVQLDGVAYNADGLVPASILEEGTGRVGDGMAAVDDL